MANNVEDKLVDGWTENDKRSLLDYVTGGAYKDASEIPPLSDTGKITNHNLRFIYDKFFPDEVTEIDGHKVMGGPGPLLEAIAPVPIVKNLFAARPLQRFIKSAATSAEALNGWIRNLESYAWSHGLMKSKKSAEIVDDIIITAKKRINTNTGNVESVRNQLRRFEAEVGVGDKNLIPDNRMVPGKAKRTGRTPVKREISKMTEQRQSAERAEKMRARKASETGDEPYQRGAQKLD